MARPARHRAGPGWSRKRGCDRWRHPNLFREIDHGYTTNCTCIVDENMDSFLLLYDLRNHIVPGLFRPGIKQAGGHVTERISEQVNR